MPLASSSTVKSGHRVRPPSASGCSYTYGTPIAISFSAIASSAFDRTSSLRLVRCRRCWSKKLRPGCCHHFDRRRLCEQIGSSDVQSPKPRAPA